MPAVPKILEAFRPFIKSTPAAKAAPAAPQSLLCAPDENRISDVETIRRTVAGLAAGEGCDDPAAYRAAAIRRGFGPIHEKFAIEALRSIGDLSNWADEYADRLEQIEADEIKWSQEYKRLDVALSAARIKHRKAVTDRENLRGEDQQNRYVKQVNPFLLGTPEQATAAITEPALTRQECAMIRGQLYQEWQITQVRAKKMHYAQQEQQQAAK